MQTSKRWVDNVWNDVTGFDMVYLFHDNYNYIPNTSKEFPYIQRFAMPPYVWVKRFAHIIYGYFSGT